MTTTSVPIVVLVRCMPGSAASSATPGLPGTAPVTRSSHRRTRRRRQGWPSRCPGRARVRARWIGIGLPSLVNISPPKGISLGGSLARLLPLESEVIETEVICSASCRPCTQAGGRRRLGDRAPLIGAGTLALNLSWRTPPSSFGPDERMGAGGATGPAIPRRISCSPWLSTSLQARSGADRRLGERSPRAHSITQRDAVRQRSPMPAATRRGVTGLETAVGDAHCCCERTARPTR